MTTEATLAWVLSTPAPLEAIEELLGLQESSCSILRHGTHLVLKADHHPFILRCHDRGELSWLLTQGSRLRYLFTMGAPLLLPLGSPWVRPEGILTLWQEGVPPLSPEALGACLRRLHSTPLLTTLPQVTVTSRFRERFALLSPTLPLALRQKLEEKCAEAIVVFAQAEQAGLVNLHGDAHGGNGCYLEGKPLLLDLDDLCQGPAFFDLLPSYCSYRRFHQCPAQWQAFQKGYGRGPWEELPTLAVVREATMNSWLALQWERGGMWQEELRHRLATWDEEDHVPWHAL